jgi:hypothetical protein
MNASSKDCGKGEAARPRLALECAMHFSCWVRGMVALVCLFSGAGGLLAQQEPVQNAPALPASPTPATNAPAKELSHRFWDRENVLLFAGVAGSRALDYSSTLNMRRRGRQEILLSDWVVDHHGLFAGIEVSAAALSLGTSYALHRTGHHKLERWVSIAHIGVGTGGAVRNYCLQTAHRPPGE